MFDIEFQIRKICTAQLVHDCVSVFTDISSSVFLCMVSVSRCAHHLTVAAEFFVF